jgi:hypothetical protein
MNLSRRSLLTGLLSSAAVIAAGPVAKVIPREPTMLTLADWAARIGDEKLRLIAEMLMQSNELLDELIAGSVETFVVGNPDAERSVLPGLIFRGVEGAA